VVSNHNIGDAIFTLYEKIGEHRKARIIRNSETETVSKQEGEGVRISVKKKEDGWCRC